MGCKASSWNSLPRNSTGSSQIIFVVAYSRQSANLGSQKCVSSLSHLSYSRSRMDMAKAVSIIPPLEAFEEILNFIGNVGCVCHTSFSTLIVVGNVTSPLSAHLLVCKFI